MSERGHTGADWRQLGQHLHRAHEELMDAYIKAWEMWGNEEDTPRKILHIHGALGALRVELDGEYHREKKEYVFGFPDPLFGADQRIRDREIPIE